MPSTPQEAAKKELWTAVSMDRDIMVLLKMDKEQATAYAKRSDGCVEIEDWDEVHGVCIGLKGTEGLRKFAGLISSRLNRGGRPVGRPAVGKHKYTKKIITKFEPTHVSINSDGSFGIGGTIIDEVEDEEGIQSGDENKKDHSTGAEGFRSGTDTGQGDEPSSD